MLFVGFNDFIVCLLPAFIIAKIVVCGCLAYYAYRAYA